MIKKIILVRHAKADWSIRDFSDHDRVLNLKGISDASEMALKSKIKDLKPDYILSSTAQRALQTAEKFNKVWSNGSSKIYLEPKIYEAKIETLWDIIHNLPNEASNVALFGHNPSFTQLGCDLGQVIIDDLPPCGMMVFNFDVSSWETITPKSGRLLFYDYPQS